MKSVVITNNKNFYHQVKKLKAFGIDKDIKDRKLPGKYDVKKLGFNYRMTELHAAMGLLQLQKYNILKKLAKRYIKNLSEVVHINFNNYNKVICISYFNFNKAQKFFIKTFNKKKVGYLFSMLQHFLL